MVVKVINQNTKKLKIGNIADFEFEYAFTNIVDFHSDAFSDILMQKLKEQGLSGNVCFVVMEQEDILWMEEVYYATVPFKGNPLGHLEFLGEPEERNVNAIINKVGGTASKNAINFKVSIPSAWARAIGLGIDNTGIKMTFDGRRIIIEKEIVD